MELMDTTLVNLKVISKLQPCVKLETDGILFQQVEWSIFPEWTRRWWYGQSRQTTISKIKQLYKSAFSIAKTDDKIAVQRVMEAMCESLAGLVHLKDLKSLRSLNLVRTKINGPGLRALTKLTNLKHLDVRLTHVDISEMAKLEESLPRLRIVN